MQYCILFVPRQIGYITLSYITQLGGGILVSVTMCMALSYHQNKCGKIQNVQLQPAAIVIGNFSTTKNFIGLSVDQRQSAVTGWTADLTPSEIVGSTTSSAYAPRMTAEHSTDEPINLMLLLPIRNATGYNGSAKVSVC